MCATSATSVTRLGDFWNLFMTNLITIVGKIVGDLLGCFENNHFLSKFVAETFGETFAKIGLHLVTQFATPKSVISIWNSVDSIANQFLSLKSWSAYLWKEINQNILKIFFVTDVRWKSSVTSIKSPNVYKSYPKMISPDEWKILTHLQKLPKNVGYLDQLIVEIALKSCPKCNKSLNLVTLIGTENINFNTPSV